MSTEGGASGEGRIRNYNQYLHQIVELVNKSTESRPSEGGASPERRGHYWKFANYGAFPSNAFAGGVENGLPMYVARATHRGGLFPGKLIVQCRKCYLPWNGQEYEKTQYEVLCNFRGRWVACSGGNIPANALRGGRSETGEVLYVGRAYHDGMLTTGKVQVSLGGARVSWRDVEHQFENYEILVSDENLVGGASNHSWIPAHNSEAPPTAFIGATNNETPVYVVRARLRGGLIPGKLTGGSGRCSLPWGGAEHFRSQFEVLCDCFGSWVGCSGDNIPANALAAGRSEDGETLYVGRVEHNGEVHVGKVHSSHGVLYIAFNGEEMPFRDYEILVVEGGASDLEDFCQLPEEEEEEEDQNEDEEPEDVDYIDFGGYVDHVDIVAQVNALVPAATDGRSHSWVPAQHGQVPPGALPGGMEHGVPQYVARATINGIQVPGKLFTMYNLCYLPWEGREHESAQYEVLCHFAGKWIACSGGNVPPHALEAGRSQEGEPLYVGRAVYHRALTIGRVQASQGGLFIPWGGEEHHFVDYEILVEDLPPDYIEESGQISNTHEITDEQLEEEMRGEIALGALRTGLTVEEVRETIRAKMVLTGTNYSTSNALTKAVWDRKNKEKSDRFQPSGSDEDNRLACKICLTGELGVVFQPCGHLVSCVTCSPNFVGCPLCRAVITGRVRTYLS